MQTETSSDGFRLSPQQRRLWGLAQADPAWPCRVQALFEIEGELDRETLQAAVRQVVASHEILRTELVSRPGDALPLQVVSERTALRFHEIDLESLGTGGAGIDSIFAEIAGETCGVWLVRRTAVLHALILSLPAFYADGKGLRNLAREILSAYAGCPEMDPVQYPDVAEVFQQLLEREDTEAARAYWRGWKPEGSASRLEIAQEGEDPEIAPGPRVLPRAAAARLEELARREGGSLEDLLVVLWLVLLARLGGGPRITVGVAADGRDEEGLEGALGLFARYLPLQVEVGESLEVGALVRRVHAALGEMRRWQDFFDGESSGVFPFCFDFPLQEDHSCAGLKLRPLRERGGSEPFHLGLACRRSAGELSFGLSHDGRLYDAAQAQEVELRFGVLIEELLASPGARVGELGILTPAERQLLLVEVNDTGAAGDPGRCAHELFEEQAARTPDAVAVRAGDRNLTYAELEARANRLARFLRKLGVGPETRVGVRMERSPDLLVALLGILKAGGAYVPVDSTYPEERQAFLLENAEVSLLLTEGDGEGTGVRRLSLERSRDAIARESACRPPAVALPGQLAYVLYTSGSTGRPKGVMVPHAGLVNYLRWCGRAYMAGPVSTVPVHSPLGFDLTVTSLLAPLTVGWTVELLPDGTGVEALAETIAEGGPWGLLKITPSHLEVLAQLLEERQVEARVEALIVGGEALRGESLEFWARHSPATRVVNEYGPTEAVVGCCTYELAAGAMSAGPVAIGRPIDNARIYLLDPGLQPVPPGGPGQLFLGGIGLARGYQGAPHLTAGRFLPDPFSEQPGSRLYVTGDLARWLPSGQLEFLGRVDHQIKIRGFRIEPGEIEAVLGQHPAVREAVVIAREDVPGDRRLVSYLVLEPGSSLDPADLRQWTRRTLPEHMVPSAYVALESIPLTVNGKVDRAALPSPARLEPRADRATPTPLEDEIAAIWREILGVESVGRKDNFFDLGGHSLLVARVRRRLEQRFGRAIAMVDLFRHPTVASLAAFLDPRESALAETAREVSSVPRETGSEIAIVGMTGRFPGASSVAELWQNLRDGVEGITFFSEEELRAAGIAPRLLSNPRYVRAQGVLRDVEGFDAAFFGFSPREAELTDPQQRVFLECAWEALESAGYDPERYPGRIGVFAGVSANTYWHHLASNPQLVEEVGGFQLVLANDKDFLPTRVSYKLNLTGPSVNVQTACSTSLVAIHLACRSLRSREADMALAGGISIRLPQQAGYLYQEGGISSPDGHCRAFDAQAQGTLRGNGVGVVVLKRLSDALADGDFIHAVIKGSAVNNDGARKIGFTAPSVEGQVAVLREAFADAGIEPETLSYVEAHGTGTALGDPIEVAALSEALGGPGRTGELCALGSVKTNVGHLDAAAGVTGLIKTVLALEHRAIPPSLHFEEPNPEIDFANGPCYVNGRLSEWEAAGHPRRAGVSAFGIGGTNAHVVLEEAPAIDGTAPTRRWQLIPLSARTPAALEAATANLADFLAARGDASLADVAYTLQVGRRAFQHRRIVVADSHGSAVEALRTLTPERVFTQAPGSARAPVVFLFPGQGSQSVGMGRELYETEPTFREQIDRCAERLRPHLGFDFRRELYPETEGEAGILDRTSLTQPVLFSFEYALARLWMEWGAHPQAMVGHSLGEYVAACLAGVFTLEEALDLVAERGRMMQQLPAGSMLAVRLPEDELRPRLLPGLSLAAVNGPSDCVVSGPADILETLQRSLAGEGHQARPVATSHAFHSAMMDPILEAFRARVRQVSLRPPRIPFLSNLSGTWITDSEATDPEYWARHLRHPVQFARNLEALFADPERLFLEVGPGRTLGALLLRHRQCPAGATVLASLHRSRNRGDLEAMLEARGRLWLAGVELEEPGLWARERRRRLPLPTYPWERQRFWIEPGREELSRPAALQRREEIADWFHVPSWKRTAPPTPALRPQESQGWLVFAEGNRLSSQIIEQLEAQGQTVVAVEAGGGFEQLSEGAYLLDPRERGDYEALVHELRRTGRVPRRVVHLWNTGERAGGPPTPELAEEALHQGFYSLIFLVQALGGQSHREPLDILVASTGLHDVTGREALHPERATLLGACRVLPQELRQVSCRSVDLDMPGDRQAEEMARRLLAELDAEPSPGLVAYRGKHRWVEGFDTVRLREQRNEAPRLREGGTYLLTGGLGGLALEVARDLARRVRARLVLVGRTPLPPREEWDGLIADPDTTEALRRRIAAVRDLEELGAEVLVLGADVADREPMREAIAQARQRFGDIHGVIHTAGVAGGGLIDLRSPRESAGVLDPKVRGTLVLRELLEGTPLDFLVLFSSLNSVLGGFGQADYCAANAFLDAFAHWSRSEDGTACTSIGWVAWQEVGMAADAHPAGETPEQRRERLGHGVSTADGVEAFRRILAADLPQVLVSPRDLAALVERVQRRMEAGHQARPEAVRPQAARHARPEIATSYASPRNEAERTLSELYAHLLGLERVGIHDNFFEIGGDSLLSIQIVARAGEAGLRITTQQVFEHPTVAELAAAVTGGTAMEPEPAGDPEPDRAGFSLARLDPATLARIAAEHGDVEDVYPLSPTQSGMLFFHLYAPGSEAYFQLMVWTLRGALDVPAFKRAWDRLVQRHSVLRTCFVWQGLDEPHQVVHRSVELPWIEEDLRGLSEDERRERLRELLRQDRNNRLDLSSSPILRLAILRLGEEEYQFVWSWHHILFDGWSMTLLTRQAMGAYHAEIRGEAPDAEPVPQYRDYIAWLERQDRGAAEAFWRRALEGFDTPTPLPLDRSPGRLVSQRQRVRGQRSVLSTQETTELKAFARRHQLTLSTLVQGAWALLLSSASGERDVVFGITSSGRPASLPGVESIVGLMITTLPLRAAAVPEAGLIPWLKSLQQTQAEVRRFEHSSLAQIQAWSSVPGNRVLFDSLLVFQGNPVDVSVEQWGKTGGPSVANHGGLDSTSYPLVVYVVPGRELQLRIAYDSLRFDAPTIQRLRLRLETLLRTMVAAPEAALSDLLVPGEIERQQMLVEWNDSSRGFDETACVHHLFEAWADRDPGATAVVLGGESWTYGELERSANRLAHHLLELGVGIEDRVGICLERSFDLIAALLAVLKAGAAYVPLDPTHPAERLSGLAREAGLAALITRRTLASSFSGPVPRFVFPAEEPALALCSERRPARAVGGDALAYVMFTSGSTGHPKGVLVPHRGLASYIGAVIGEWELGPEDRVLQFASLGFDTSAEEIFGCLGSGAALVLRPEGQLDSVASFLRLCREQEVSVLDLPTAYWHILAAELGENLELPPRVRLVVLGGEAALSERLGIWWEKVPASVRLVNTYGPSEATIVATSHEPVRGQKPAFASPTVPIGSAVPNARVYLLGKDLQPVALGRPGALSIGGSGVARGYLNDPRLTAEKFTPDPFGGEPGARLYATGDLARRLPDGALEFLGRVDNQVKLRGIRIEPGEIEAALGSHPAVRESAVVVRDNGADSRRLVAYVVAEPGEAPEVEELRDFLRGRLPSSMVPSAFVLLAALPLTPSGKIDRGALPAPEKAGLPGRSDAVSARNPLEAHLIRIWEEVLDTRPIGVTDSFFELGGHSLLVVRLMSRLAREFHRDLPLAALFQEPTIQGLAKLLRSPGLSGEGAAPVPLQPQGDRRPLFFVHPVGGTIFCYLDLARRMGSDQPFYALQAPGETSSIEALAAHHLAAIRAVQPEGPYRLGGWSMGGVVAFEMARQLVENGEPVELVAVVDASAPVEGRIPPVLDGPARVVAFARDLGRLYGRPLAIPGTVRLKRSEEKSLRQIFERAQKDGTLPGDLPFAEILRLYRIFESNYRAVQQYLPGGYPGRVTLFASSRGQSSSPLDATLGWSELADGGVEVHAVPGDHYSILQPPQAEILAARLRSALERTERGCDALEPAALMLSTGTRP